MHAALARLLERPIAHRGLHACGAPGPVENSIGAALAAAAAGYGIECDVVLSRDGEAMVFHDETLARLTGVDGEVGDHDAAALGRLALRGGPDRIPTLSEVLAAIAGRVPVVVEIKRRSAGDMRLADRTLGLAEAYAGPIAIESFDPAVVRRCRDRGAHCPIGLVGPAEDGADVPEAAFLASDFLSWSIDHLAAIAARPAAPPLTTWTVRDAAQAAQARRLGAQIVFEGFTPATDA